MWSADINFNQINANNNEGGFLFVTNFKFVKSATACVLGTSVLINSKFSLRKELV